MATRITVHASPLLLQRGKPLAQTVDELGYRVAAIELARGASRQQVLELV